MVGLVDKIAVFIAILPAVTEIVKNHTSAAPEATRVQGLPAQPRLNYQVACGDVESGRHPSDMIRVVLFTGAAFYR